MREEKIEFAGINAGDNIYWAGGYTGDSTEDHPTCSVEIKDVQTGSSAIQQLSHPAAWLTNRGTKCRCERWEDYFYGRSDSGSLQTGLTFMI